MLFKGNRFAVFDWQLESLMQILGPHCDGFHLDEWLDTLDRETAVILPAGRDERWAWLQRQLVEEAQRRGLPMASPSGNGLSAQGQQNAAAMARAAERIMARGEGRDAAH